VKRLEIDTNYVCTLLLRLLEIPSPSGYTDSIVHFVGQELERLGIRFELTRRGAIRANLKGEVSSPDRAVAAHLDTLGIMVKRLKENGRLEVVPIGTWASRFAEGARVTVFTDGGSRRGTILPLKASGHTFDDEVDTQPSSWTHVELRIDDPAFSAADLARLGFHVGDFAAVDPEPEMSESGYIVSRHLDDKAGVAAMLGAARAIVEEGVTLPVDLHLLFTITEEVGSGASGILHGDVAEMVVIDNGTPAPGQNSRETGVTIAIMDSSGPFDYHLTRKLIDLCEDHRIDHQRDVFLHYRCDAASALVAGCDSRTALVCFGVDASHGHERTHVDSIRGVAQLMTLYAQSPPTFKRDRLELAPLEGFSTQPEP